MKGNVSLAITSCDIVTAHLVRVMVVAMMVMVVMVGMVGMVVVAVMMIARLVMLNVVKHLYQVNIPSLIAIQTFVRKKVCRGTKHRQMTGKLFAIHGFMTKRVCRCREKSWEKEWRLVNLGC